MSVGLYRGHLCDDCGKGYGKPLTDEERQLLKDEGYVYQLGIGVSAARIEIHRIRCGRVTRFQRSEVV